ncbi:hypothetical protein BLNAU_21703 [Blattamonas nauphoetae]|uniref:Uncharacterized protein n=1 Tax=Blattamonas nauphoetae TaxID=2049346 RepID=A0ABQ9WVN4_9EUKA|nr:hypothetical protein BLNAU_21703 [Blattamonas nauphoetae]
MQRKENRADQSIAFKINHPNAKEARADASLSKVGTEGVGGRGPVPSLSVRPFHRRVFVHSIAECSSIPSMLSNHDGGVNFGGALTSIDPSFTYFDGTTQMPGDASSMELRLDGVEQLRVMLTEFPLLFSLSIHPRRLKQKLPCPLSADRPRADGGIGLWKVRVASADVRGRREECIQFEIGREGSDISA